MTTHGIPENEYESLEIITCKATHELSVSEFIENIASVKQGMTMNILGWRTVLNCWEKEN